MISDAEDDPQGSRSRSKLHEIDLLDLLRDLWGGRKSILALVGLVVLWSIVGVWTARPTYTATMLVGPPEQTDGDRSISGAISKLSGAASALGISGLGAGDSSLFSKYGSVLESFELASAVLKHDELKPMLFGPTWHPKTRTFERPREIDFQIKDFLKGLLGLPTWAPPGPVSMRAKLHSLVHLTPDKVKGFLNISADGNSPEEALALLEVVYKEADEILRSVAKERAQARIDYLSNALQHTTLQDQRTAMIDVLSMQEQGMMMAAADKTMAIVVIDPPIVDPTPSAPKPRVVLLTNILLAIALGGLLSVVIGVRQRRAARLAAAVGEEPEPQYPADVVVKWYLRKWLDRVPWFRRNHASAYADRDEREIPVP